MDHGSFTGIRIGVSSVKALAEVHKIKIAEVTSLEVLAENATSKIRVGMIDARNDQVYVGIFDKDRNLLEDYIADSINIAIEKISKFDDVEISGNGAEKFKNEIISKIPNAKFSLDNSQKAENVGKIGFRKFQKNETVNSDNLMPIYLRKSQAERMKGQNK